MNSSCAAAAVADYNTQNCPSDTCTHPPAKPHTPAAGIQKNEPRLHACNHKHPAHLRNRGAIPLEGLWTSQCMCVHREWHGRIKMQAQGGNSCHKQTIPAECRAGRPSKLKPPETRRNIMEVPPAHHGPPGAHWRSHSCEGRHKQPMLLAPTIAGLAGPQGW